MVVVFGLFFYVTRNTAPIGSSRMVSALYKSGFESFRITSTVPINVSGLWVRTLIQNQPL